jgi:molecular chaperone HscA
LINEPTAAAIAYGLNKEDNHNIAVYDLGGGTFDISILKITKGIFKVLSTGGDTNLGGDDFDYELSKYVSTKIDYEIDSNNKEYLYEISKVKELLSKNESIEYKFKQFPHFPLLKINRDEFNKLIKSYIDKTLTTIKQALEDAELHSSEIDEIIMVGGSTRIPFVRDEISKFFNKKVLTNLNPDEAVVIGAGLQASSFFQKNTDFLLLDVIPLSLGVETYGGLMDIIIPRNSSIPCSYSKEFTNFLDGQSAMSIHVLQGERDAVDECRSLGKFNLVDLPPMLSGTARIEVNFQIDADGLLSVSAIEKTKGVKSSIEVLPSYGLSSKEVEEMIITSHENSESDKNYRALQESLVEAERILIAIKSAMEIDKKLLSDDMESNINQAIDNLKNNMKKKDVGEVKKAIMNLEKKSEEFIEKRMNSSLDEIIKGKKIEDIDNA